MRYARHYRKPESLWPEDEVTDVDVPIDVLDRPVVADPPPVIPRTVTFGPRAARTTTAPFIAAERVPARPRTLTRPYMHPPVTIVLHPSTAITVNLRGPVS